MIRFCLRSWSVKMKRSRSLKRRIPQQRGSVNQYIWKTKTCTLISVYLAWATESYPWKLRFQGKRVEKGSFIMEEEMAARQWKVAPRGQNLQACRVILNTTYHYVLLPPLCTSMWSRTTKRRHGYSLICLAAERIMHAFCQSSQHHCTRFFSTCVNSFRDQFCFQTVDPIENHNSSADFPIMMQMIYIYIYIYILVVVWPMDSCIWGNYHVTCVYCQLS